MEINYIENKFLKINVNAISLDEIVLKSGYKLAPFVPIEDTIKWVSDLLTDSKSIKEFKIKNKFSG